MSRLAPELAHVEEGERQQQHDESAADRPHDDETARVRERVDHLEPRVDQRHQERDQQGAEDPPDRLPAAHEAIETTAGEATPFVDGVGHGEAGDGSAQEVGHSLSRT